MTSSFLGSFTKMFIVNIFIELEEVVVVNVMMVVSVLVLLINSGLQLNPVTSKTGVLDYIVIWIHLIFNFLIISSISGSKVIGFFLI